MRLIYDLECDGLDPTVIWCIVALNLDTQQIYKFSDHDNLHGTIKDGVRLLENASLLVGHNIILFDNRVIDKLYGTNLNTVKTHDTFIMSQVLRYKRKHRHGLAGWGEALGNAKTHYDDWSKYTREMLNYCVQDVKVNADVYNALLNEFNKIHAAFPLIKEGLKIEHDTAVFNATVRTRGWKFDVPKAKFNLERMNQRMTSIEEAIEPRIGTHTVYIDKEPKSPKFKKNGDYNAATCRQLADYFGHPVNPSDTHLVAAGEVFQRSREEPTQLGSLELVKKWLLKQGWKPDEHQRKKVGNQWVSTSPKLTTTSLHKLGHLGEDLDEYYTIRNRAATIRSWLEQEQNGRLHGNMWTCGTPTFRCRHEVIVNLPAVTAAWGLELRELLIADDNCVIVGADSAGNQLRGLCHYVNNDDFTREVVHGDQHQRNADVLGCDRSTAKSYLYAFLFGAGDQKLGSVLTGKLNATKGKDSRAKFSSSIKGLKELREKINKVWKGTMYAQGEGWMPALDGRPIFVAGEHQTLNYLLQTAEAITCKAALSYALTKIHEEGLKAEPRIFYHDELAFNAPIEEAERVGEILQEAFRIGPQTFNVDCMDGGKYVIGKSYADVH